MLAFSHVSVRTGKTEILRDVDFSLTPGRITVLLGKNGSGKSTLLQCVNRMRRYDGTILLAGADIASLSPVERARRVALFPQFLPETAFTVETLVSLGRSPYTGPDGRLSAADREAVQDAMALAGVTEYRQRTVSSLSGGEKQRAWLAMVLAQDTPLLLLDEPASFLDTDARRELYEILRLLVRERGKTVLTVLHDLNEAVRLGEDVVVLADHTACFRGSFGECLDCGVLERIFSVRRFTVTDEDGSHLFFS